MNLTDSPASASDTATPAAESLPDYKIAAAELAALWAATGLTADIDDLRVDTDEPMTRSGKGWPHVAVKVTIFRPEVYASKSANYRPADSVTLDYKMGLGCADWKAVSLKGLNIVPREDLPDIKGMIRGGVNDATAKRLASRYLWAFKMKVNPAEVLAYYCREGQDANGQSFESWAAEFGYDVDSRKAEAIYRACQQNGDKAARILRGTGATPAQFAELANRL